MLSVADIKKFFIELTCWMTAVLQFLFKLDVVMYLFYVVMAFVQFVVEDTS
jgi:hypothetical protein